jgi:hypothetical protein
MREVACEDVIAEAELSKAQVADGPPGMVGSSNDTSIW